MEQNFFDAVEKAFNKGATSNQQFISAKEYIEKVSINAKNKLKEDGEKSKEAEKELI